MLGRVYGVLARNYSYIKGTWLKFNPQTLFFSLLTFSTFLRAKEEETVFSFINAFSDLMHEGTLLALCSGVVA